LCHVVEKSIVILLMEDWDPLSPSVTPATINLTKHGHTSQTGPTNQSDRSGDGQPGNTSTICINSLFGWPELNE
jgi:hypothetical protein